MGASLYYLMFIGWVQKAHLGKSRFVKLPFYLV